MRLSLDKKELRSYVGKQLELFFPDGRKYWGGEDVETALQDSLERCEYCFRYITKSGYIEAGEPCFSHTHSDQYATFLYFFANCLWKISENKEVCDRLIVLNRYLHGFWLTYKVKMPDIFLLVHPIGTILGHASYTDFLVVSQNVTVNSGNETDDGGRQLPSLGKGLYLASGAQIIGNQVIGKRVCVGVNAVLYKRDVPDDTNVMNIDGKVVIQGRAKPGTAQLCFNVPIE